MTTTDPTKLADRIDRMCRDALAGGVAPVIDYDTLVAVRDILRSTFLMTTADPLVDELEPIIKAALEPLPMPLPEQDSRVGEAMAGQADMRARREWKERVERAQDKLAKRGSAILAALRRPTPPSDVAKALDWFRRNADGLFADVPLAHRSRGNGCTEWMAEDDRDFRCELAKHLAALASQDAPSVDAAIERRDGPIGEHLLSGLERTPQAAAERVLAFLDWKGEGFGSVGPSLNYGDLRILAEYAASLPSRESIVAETVERCAKAAHQRNQFLDLHPDSPNYGLGAPRTDFDRGVERGRELAAAAIRALLQPPEGIRG